VREHLDAYLNHELPLETQQQISAHLARCPGCARACDARRQLKAALRRAVNNDEAPAALRERIRRRLRRN
jgi:anti-sigma factor (TIGR02949 family)